MRNVVIVPCMCVAAIFHSLYSTVQISLPTRISRVHLRVQSSEFQILSASAAEAFGGTHSWLIVRRERFLGRTIWNIMLEWPISARSCNVNPELDPSTMIYSGMQYVCLHTPFGMLWCAIWMFVCTIWNMLLCPECMFASTTPVSCVVMNLPIQLS